MKELFAGLNVTPEVLELDLIGKHDFTSSDLPMCVLRHLSAYERHRTVITFDERQI